MTRGRGVSAPPADGSRLCRTVSHKVVIDGSGGHQCKTDNQQHTREWVVTGVAFQWHHFIFTTEGQAMPLNDMKVALWREWNTPRNLLPTNGTEYVDDIITSARSLISFLVLIYKIPSWTLNIKIVRFRDTTFFYCCNRLLGCLKM